MITYALQVGICWLVFFSLYYFLLKKETFHSYNRFYLIGTLLMSLFIPYWSTYEPVAEVSQSVPIVYDFEFIIPDSEVASVTTDEESSFNWWSLFNYIYWVGVFFFSVRLILGLSQIYTFFKTGTKQRQGDIVFVENDRKHLPFSFFNFIFLSNNYKINGDVNQIVQHEIVHAQQLHSLDVLLVELVQIVFWFNPLVLLYKRAIKETHEYIADSTVIENSDIKIYSAMLLSHVNSRTRHAITNQFFQKQIKKRIQMMKRRKSKSSLRFKYLMALPVMVGLTVFTAVGSNNNSLISKSIDKVADLMPISSTVLKTDNFSIEKPNISLAHSKVNVVKDTIPAPPPPPPAPPAMKATTPPPPPPPPGSSRINESDIFERAEQMPRFPGCEDIVGDNLVKEACSKKKMLDYLYANLKYPELAKSKGVEGMSVVRFVVRKDGYVDNIKIVRNPGAGTGEAAAKVVESMNFMGERWTPGKNRGVEANVRYTLPIKFKLDSGPKKYDKRAFFTECSDDSTCSFNRLNSIVRDVLKNASCIHNSSLIIKIKVEVTGDISDVQIIRGVSSPYDKYETILLDRFNELDWSPATLNGNPVESKYSFSAYVK